MNKFEEKRIALVTSSLVGGGAEKLNLTLKSFLQSRGCHVDLIVLSSRNIDYEISKENTFFLDSTYQKPFFSFLDYPLKAKALDKLINDLEVKNNNKYDFILASLSGTHKLFKRLKRKNVIYWVHNTLSKELEKYSNKRKYLRKFKEYKKTYKGKNIIVTSNGVKEDLITNFKLQNENVTVLYNFFDFELIAKLAKEKMPFVPFKSKEYLIHVGRFSAQKRHDVLLDSYKASGIDIPLVLLCKPEVGLKNLIVNKQLESKVFVAGFQQNPYKWIKNAKLLVLTSDYEGFGNVIVEALALETPVVSTNCPSGPEEILTGEYTSGLCKVGDVDGISNKMLEMLSSELIFNQADLEKIYGVNQFANKLFEILES